MPIPTDAPSRASRMAFDFTERQARQAKSRSARVVGVDGGSGRQRPGRRRRHRVRRPHPWSAPGCRRRFHGTRPGRRRRRAGMTSSRMFFFLVSTARAASSKPGASSTSVKTSAICSASAAVTVRLTAITPPNAETGSQARAFTCAARSRSSSPPVDHRDATGIGVLDDRHRGIREVVRRTPCRVDIDVVVVAHLFSVQLLRPRPGHRASAGTGLHPGAGSRRTAGRTAAPRSIRSSAASRPSSGETTAFIHDATATSYDAVCAKALAANACRCARLNPPARRSGDDVGVVGRFDHGGDTRMILRGGPDHRGTTDVDLLDAVVYGRPGRDGGAERVEVHDDQIEGLDAQLLQLVEMTGQPGVGEQPAVDLGVQRLHPTVETLREAGDLLDLLHRQAGLGDRRRRIAGGDQVDTLLRPERWPIRSIRSCPTPTAAPAGTDGAPASTPTASACSIWSVMEWKPFCPGWSSRVWPSAIPVRRAVPVLPP